MTHSKDLMPLYAARECLLNKVLEFKNDGFPVFKELSGKIVDEFLHNVYAFYIY